MKRNTNVLLAVVLLMSASCAENKLADFNVEKPENIARYEYLNDYSTLSTYVVDDIGNWPFKIGAVADDAGFVGGGKDYSLISSNFNELTPKTGMWHSSCVQGNGTMDFQSLKKLLSMTQTSGMTVFGNALCSHDNQNVAYLNGLLADKPLPETRSMALTRASGMKKVYLVDTDFENGLTVAGGKWSAWGDAIKKHGNFWKVVDGEGYNKTKGYKIKVGSGYAASKGQTVVEFSPEVPAVENTTYYLTMKVKASRTCSITSEFRANGSSTAIGKFSSPINVSTEWQTVTVSCPSVSGNIFRFYLNVGTVAGTIWFDDLSVYYEIPTGIPQTPEEKADTLTWAMDNWVSGLMEACGGVVTDWNVVDSPLSDEDADQDGYYDLRSADNGDAETYFYWGDYLGVNYPRLIVELARKYGPEASRLYVNESGLESDAKKLSSLLHWIEQWESDGKTVIDGIAMTMHLTLMMDEEAQAQQEANLKNALAQLANTGKLIRISGLDMTVVDESGMEMSVTDLTFAQEKRMAEFYTFVLSAYAELVPVKHQGGVTQWTITDSNNVPNGLWSKDYTRKPAYAGFAEGLKMISFYAKN